MLRDVKEVRECVSECEDLKIVVFEGRIEGVSLHSVFGKPCISLGRVNLRSVGPEDISEWRAGSAF